MSGHLARGPAPPIARYAIVAGGTSILLARPFVASAPEGRTALFAAAYVAIGLAAAAMPDPTGERVRRAAAVPLLAGLLAVAIASTATGAAVPVPWGAAALPLSVLAAVAEEALFRHGAYGSLARAGAPAAIVGSALLFALVHVPAYGVAALPVDLAAGLLFGWQRWTSGTWGVPAATHAFANVLAVLR
jgi:membrane protease YdiL (CAAX protease family)